MMNTVNPTKLSVVVAMVSDTTETSYDLSHLSGCLESLTSQIDPPTMEIIVPYPSNVEGMEQLENQFEAVRFLPITDLKWYTGQSGSREHHDELRARGLLAASGKIVGMVEDHARPDRYWAQKMVAAHSLKYAGVGGAMDNGVDKPLNWAVYFCDFSKYQNPLTPGETQFVSDANVTYDRSTLKTIKDVWEEAFHEAEVNWALLNHGARLYLTNEAIVYQYRKGLRLGNALKERFIWGRSFATSRGRIISLPRKAIYIVVSPILPILIPLRIGINTVKKRRHGGAYLKSLPYIILLTCAWSAGELTGYFSK